MVNLLASLSLTVLMSCILIAQRQNVFSPASITVVGWLVTFGSGLYFRSEFLPLHDSTVFLWMVWFSISCLLYIILAQPTDYGALKANYVVPFNYTPLVAVSALVMIYQIWQIGSTGGAAFFLNLRLSATGSDEVGSLGPVARIYPLIYALFIFECMNSRPENRYRRYALWGWMLIYAVATMGKFAILTPVFSWLLIKQRHGKISIKYLAIVAFALIALMLTAHIVRAGESDDTSIFYLLAIYIYSPIIAFGQMDIVNTGLIGEYTFRFFHAISHQLFGGAPPVATILPYVEIPHFTNVYTVMQPFYADFGLIGVVFGSAVYGLLYGLLYRLYCKGNHLGVAIYSGLGVSLISQLFSETLIMNFSGNLQFVAAFWFIKYFSREETKCQ